MDPDPDPAIFVIDLQDVNNKLILKKSFSAYYFLKVHLHHFSKIKSPKEVTKQQESKFFWDPDPVLTSDPNNRPVQIRNTVQTDELIMLKVPKCEIFDRLIFMIFTP